MARTATYVVELLVGAVCLGLAFTTWRHRGVVRIVSIILAVAGASAVAHAVLALAQ